MSGLDPFPFMLLEAVASVALSHDADCACTTCRAAAGDEAALAEIAKMVGRAGSPGDKP